MDLAKRIFPLLRTLEHYSRADFRNDLAAGITTAAMLVPQGMAYAMLAGLPPIIGVYAALVPGIFYALLGTSRQLSVGPAAMDSLLVAASLGSIAQVGTDEYVQTALFLGILVGAIQIGLGLFRMGFLVNFLSTPVVAGFTSAAAILIGLSQAKHLLGIRMDDATHVVPLVRQLGARVGDVHWPTTSVALSSIVFLVLLKKLAPRVPRAMIALVLGSLLVGATSLFSGVAQVGQVPAGLPGLRLPVASWATLSALLPAACTIAVISFMESISTAKTYAGLNKYTVAPDRELVALGVGNLMGGLFQGYPVAGGLARTAVNAQAGAKTPVAALITAAVVALSLLFLTPFFSYLPKAVLAAIIVTAVIGLVDMKEVKHLRRVKKADLVLLTLTFVATLDLGIVEGLTVGVAASLAWMIYSTSRPHVAILGRVPGTQLFRNVARQSGLITYKAVLIVRMDAQYCFANVAYLRSTLERAEANMTSTLRAIVLDASAINQLDSSAESALSEMWEAYQARNVSLVLASVKGPVRDVLELSGLTEKMGAAGRCLSVYDALELLDARPEDLAP